MLKGTPHFSSLQDGKDGDMVIDVIEEIALGRRHFPALALPPECLLGSG